MKETIYKILIGIALGGIIFLIFKNWGLKRDLKKSNEEKLELLESVKRDYKKQLDSIESLKEEQLNSLRSDVENLSEYTNRLNQKIRQYEKAPDYDIDFLTAAELISRSEYRSSQ